MTIPKAYQVGYSPPSTQEILEKRKAFFSLYRIYNHLKYYFVFFSLCSAFILCLGKAFQHVETVYQETSSSKTTEKKETSFLLSLGRLFPFQIGKNASASTNTTTPGKTATSGTASTAPQPPTPQFDPLSSSSEEEVKVLQTLAKRRKELDKREEIIAQKELLIATAQTQVKEQMDSLNKLKADIEETLKVADKTEKDKILILVKIYESMKPKEAARIFDQMDIKLLADVLKLMNQKKMSNILAQMNVKKAKELTTLVISLKSPYAVLDHPKGG